MVEPRRSKPFVRNDNSLLALGFLARESGIPASQHLQITDEVVALDFNLAVTLRLLRYDEEKVRVSQKNLAARIANAVSRAMGFGGDDEADFDAPHKLLKDDPYADEFTVIN